MSVSMYSGQVARSEKEIADLQRKAAGERERAAKERGGAVQKRGQITRNTSDSQRLGKERDAARAEEKAAKHESKAADFDRQASQKGDQLQRARANLARAEASDREKDERKRKQDLDREKRDLAEIERRRRSLQSAPAFEPHAIPWRGEPIEPSGRPPESSTLSDFDDGDDAAPVFDVCLSFAGEQRSYVELVARGLKDRGYAVFYDVDEQANLWGKNLTEHFEYVYRVASRACVMFISAEYAEKPWTKHERRSALARALEEDEYVLPARFDDTELPGLAPTIGYIDLAEIAPASLVDLLTEKLGEPQGTGG
ncbi:MAG: TIR domain-containing protein [Actinobacteria bacterium]|nr:TIR domain-containing protein [Actinomycetota bacterium]